MVAAPWWTLDREWTYARRMGKGRIRNEAPWGRAARRGSPDPAPEAHSSLRHGAPRPVREQPLRSSNGRGPSFEGTPARLGLHRDTLQRWMLVPADVLSAALAVTLGVTVFGEDRLSIAIVASVPLVVLASKVMGLYDRDQHLLRKTTLDEAPALFQLATLYTLLLWLSQPLLVEGHLGRDQVVGLWGLLFVLLLVGRTVARHLARAVAGPERCLVIGHAESAERVRKKIESSF